LKSQIEDFGRIVWEEVLFEMINCPLHRILDPPLQDVWRFVTDDDEGSLDNKKEIIGR
jgi:hypothetical protein